MADKPPLYVNGLSNQFTPREIPAPQTQQSPGLTQVLTSMGLGQLLREGVKEGSSSIGSMLSQTDTGISPIFGSEGSALTSGITPNMSIAGADGSAGVAQATGLGGAPVASSLLNTASGLAGAYGVYDVLKNDREGLRGYGQAGLSGFAAGNAVGGPVGGGIAALAAMGLKGIQDLTDSGKPREQKARDDAKDVMRTMGIVQGPQHGQATLNTYGGDTLDISQDGGGQGNYNVDFSNPMAGQAVALVNPLAAIVAARSGAKKEQVAGWLTNGILQNNKDPNNLIKEAQFLYRKLGVGPQEILDGLGQLYAQGQISKDEIDSFVATIKGISTNGQNLKVPQ